MQTIMESDAIIKQTVKLTSHSVCLTSDVVIIFERSNDCLQWKTEYRQDVLHIYNTHKLWIKIKESKQ